jgi:hypothetical protein
MLATALTLYLLLLISGCGLERWDAMIDVRVPGDARLGEWVRLGGTPYKVVQGESGRVARMELGPYFSAESCKRAALEEYERRQNSALPVHSYRCERVPLLG